MASLQGHPEWRRLFPQAPQPRDGEVVKNYPWVPVLYQEAAAALECPVGTVRSRLNRARAILARKLSGAARSIG